MRVNGKSVSKMKGPTFILLASVFAISVANQLDEIARDLDIIKRKVWISLGPELYSSSDLVYNIKAHTCNIISFVADCFIFVIV